MSNSEKMGDKPNRYLYLCGTGVERARNQRRINQVNYKCDKKKTRKSAIHISRECRSVDKSSQDTMPLRDTRKVRVSRVYDLLGIV